MNESTKPIIPANPPVETGAPAVQNEPRIYSAAQKWLLLATFVIGALWRVIWVGLSPQPWEGWYGMFWLVAMGIACLFLGRRCIKTRTAAAIGVAGVALCALQMYYGFGSALHCETVCSLYYLLLLSIPATMMLFLVFATCDVPLQREGIAATAVLRGAFVEPFTAIPDFFRATGSLFAAGTRGVWKRRLTGVAIAIPVAAGVTMLLMQADSNMNRLFTGLFANVALGEWLGHALATIVLAMLFYSLFFNAFWKPEHRRTPAYAPANWPGSTMAIIVLPLLAVYAMFLCLQFGYLFGGALPEELTYSEYARQGFAELNLVAVINFTLFGLYLRYTAPNRLRTLLCSLLLAATGLIVLSGIVRLLLYINAYGLTMMRILPLWLAVYLLALTCMSAVRLVKKNLPLVRVAGLTFLYWYVLLNLPNWAQIILRYNAVHGMG